MKKLFIFALIAIGITSATTSFAQDAPVEKKKMERKKAEKKSMKEDKKDAGMQKKEHMDKAHKADMKGMKMEKKDHKMEKKETKMQ